MSEQLGRFTIIPLEPAQFAEIRPLLKHAEDIGGALFAEIRQGTYPDTGAVLMDVGVMSKNAATKIRKVLNADAPQSKPNAE